MTTNRAILVVDDIPLNRKLLSAVLSSRGYDVGVAEDAPATLEYLRTHPVPALILMDIQLPGQDGLDLTRYLKSQPEWADVPVVAVTGYGLPSTEQAALEAGCCAYLAKPLEADVLLSYVALHAREPARRQGSLRAAEVDKRTR